MSSAKSSGARSVQAKRGLKQPASLASLKRRTRAELVWEGKYDADGRRVAPLPVSLPFQTVETVNESAQDRRRNLFARIFASGNGATDSSGAIGNTSCPSLLPEFASKVKLVYIDPPFDTGTDFSFSARVPEHGD